MVINQKPQAGGMGLPKNLRAADGCGGTLLTDRHQLAKPSGAITAVIAGCNNCTALGLTAQSSAPVIALCRRLVDADHDPALPMHVYRGDTLALIVRSIGAAANLEIHGTGTHFVGRRDRRIAPPIASTAPAGTGHRTGAAP
jgi:hypothetical protein